MAFRKECVKAFFVGLVRALGMLAIILTFVGVVMGVISFIGSLLPQPPFWIVPALVCCAFLAFIGSIIYEHLVEAGCLTKEESEDYEN